MKTEKKKTARTADLVGPGYDSTTEQKKEKKIKEQHQQQKYYMFSHTTSVL